MVGICRLPCALCFLPTAAAGFAGRALRTRGCSRFTLESPQNTLCDFQLIELSTQFFSFRIEPLDRSEIRCFSCPINIGIYLVSWVQNPTAIRTAAVFCDDRNISPRVAKNCQPGRIFDVDTEDLRRVAARDPSPLSAAFFCGYYKPWDARLTNLGHNRTVEDRTKPENEINKAEHTRLSNRRYCVCWTIRKFNRKSSPC